MSVHNLLLTRRAEVAALLSRIEGVLEGDPRVCAAWLFGSRGRGDEDDLSDLDLFVIVEDEHLGAIAAGRQTYAARLGPPLLLLEAPQNAPPDGAYLMALYDGASGPHPIDWYWQARSAARIPAQTRLLFDRAGLPQVNAPTHFESRPAPERSPIEAAAAAVNFFWVMLLITAKYVARSPHEERMGLLKYVRGALDEARRFAGAAASLPPEEPATPEPLEKLALLRDLAAQMEGLMPGLAGRGVPVPAAIVAPAQRYLDLIEAIVRELPEGNGGV